MLKTEEDTRELMSLASYTATLSKDSELGRRLIVQDKKYKEKTVRGKAHPLGPPRRGLALILIEWILEQPACPAEFKTYHQGFLHPEQIDKESLHQCKIRVTKKELTILLLNAFKTSEAVWMKALEVINKESKDSGGEIFTQKAPPGPDVREIKAWAYTKKKGEEKDEQNMEDW